MSATDAFFDTNVLLYTISADGLRATRGERLLRQGGIVSVQVLTEFVDVAQRKFHRPWAEVSATLDLVRRLCGVVNLTVETHRRSLAISQSHGFRIYDSMIVAAAMLAGCTTLYSEDMQHGQRIDSVTIRNPFSGRAAP